MWFWALSACGHQDAPEAGSAVAFERISAPGVWEQECEAAPGCAPGDLPMDRCTLEASPFAPVFADGEVIAVTVDPTAAAALGFAPGTWWTAWSDGISCERVVATFTVEEPQLAAVTP